MMLDELPTELLILIAKPLRARNINALARTSQSFYSIFNPVLYRADVRENNQSAFQWAVSHANLSTLRLTVDAGADISQPLTSHGAPGPAVFRLVRYFDPLLKFEDVRAVVRFLVERGADVSGKNARGDTVLETAVMCGNSDLARCLIEFGADVGVVARDGGCSLLHYAVQREIPVDVLEMLLRKALDVDARDKEGRTPLHRATDVEGVEFLIKNGAEVNVRALDGSTPLISVIAGSIGQRLPDGRALTKFNILLENGADSRLANQEGKTPLHFAARCEMLAFIKRLLREGVDVHARDEYGHTPLHYATTEKNRADRVRLLLESGADVHATDNKGKTPLFGVPRLGKVGLEQLVQHGADVNARDGQGNTALHAMVGWARFKSIEPDLIIALLVENGLDIDARNNDGKTAFQVAEERGDTYLLDYLRPYRPCN